MKPFGMVHSSFAQPLPKKLAGLAATPYRTAGEPVPGGPHIYPELAAAGLWTTPGDVARFALAVVAAWSERNTPVLSRSIARQMLEPGMGDYGLGLIVRGVSPSRRILHGSVNDGFVSQMVVFENGDGAAIMTNRTGAGPLILELLHSIAAEYDWPEYKPRVHQRISVDQQLLHRLVGTYVLTPDFALQVSRQGNRLFTRATGQERFELFAESNRSFFYTAFDATVSFDGEGQDNSTQLMLHQGGTDRVAKRVP